MPYTPPSQRSPASSKPGSPILSRSHSYVNESLLSPPSASATQRPSLPRSVSSTSYLNKHRRAPSIASSNAAQSSSSPSSSSSQGQSSKRSSTNGSLRQSPPPVNNLLIPTGAITTPPDSASDDEERGRQLGDLAQLQEALQSIRQKRGPSPVRDGEATVVAKTSSQSSTPPRPALTPEARKISHSRSSSEIQLSSLAPAIGDSSQSSDDSEDDDDELRMKPPLVRKKSGELVKPALRPSSRRRPSSMPGTPTFSKAVHFNDDIEQVRHFLQIDRPIAVSAGSSPVEVYDSDVEYPFDPETGYHVPRKAEWDIKLANFPKESYERSTLPVRVERIFLSSDNKTLIGTVACANISFQKHVVARFTLDYWKTTSEVVAEYNNDVRKKQLSDGYDRFNFNIKLADQANLETKTLLLCVRYNVNGQEFWDSNNNLNYQVDFSKKKAPVAKMRQVRSLSSIPRSRHSPSRGRSYPSNFEDDFSNGIDSNKYQFGSSPANTIRLKSKSNLSTEKNSHSLAFSTRYDFSTSLSAALNTAQSALGDRSGLKPKPTAGIPTTAPIAAPAGPAQDSFPASGKPDLKSAEYNELIQKFCFFGTSAMKSPTQTPPKPVAAQSDGTDSDQSSGSKNSSGSSSPSPTHFLPLMDGANDQRTPRTTTASFLSRSTSPGAFTGSDFIERTRSPMNFGYPYNHGTQNGLLGDNHTPQAILS